MWGTGLDFDANAAKMLTRPSKTLGKIGLGIIGKTAFLTVLLAIYFMALPPHNLALTAGGVFPQLALDVGLEQFPGIY